MTRNISSLFRLAGRLALSIVRNAFRRRNEWPDSSAATTLFI